MFLTGLLGRFVELRSPRDGRGAGMRSSLWGVLTCALVSFAGFASGAAALKFALDGAQVVSENTMDVLMAPRRVGRAAPASRLEGETSRPARAAMDRTPTRSIGL